MQGMKVKGGKKPMAIDSLIAAIALAENRHLVTRNEHDFQLAGVPLINPWKEV
jgi:predicted nucleic acid-binding protein